MEGAAPVLRPSAVATVSVAAEEREMADDEQPVDETLLRALGAEMIRMSRRRASTYPGALLETSAFKILWVLVDGGPRTLRELTDELQLEQSTINRQVNAAIRRGLVERYAVDGRAGLLVRPTEEGLEAYQHDRAIRSAAFRAALDSLGRTKAEALVEGLHAFNDALDAANDRP